MIAAVMQPYFFPYIGYFQLMRAVDVFVFYDDVQYINRGWVNRNRIRIGAKTVWLTLPVHQANSIRSINDRHYLLDGGKRRARNQIRSAYSRTPFFPEVYPFLDDLLAYDNSNVAVFNVNLLTSVARKLGIRCEFRNSSEVEKSPGLRGEARILDLCERMGATTYINPIGGIHLYDVGRFAAQGIDLSFLRTTIQPCGKSEDVQHLSIIDSLMQTGFAGCATQLSSFELVAPGVKHALDRG